MWITTPGGWQRAREEPSSKNSCQIAAWTKVPSSSLFLESMPSCTNSKRAWSYPSGTTFTFRNEPRSDLFLIGPCDREEPNRNITNRKMRSDCLFAALLHDSFSFLSFFFFPYHNWKEKRTGLLWSGLPCNLRRRGSGVANSDETQPCKYALLVTLLTEAMFEKGTQHELSPTTRIIRCGRPVDTGRGRMV